MRVINVSKKIIGINGDPLLPGESLELPDGYEGKRAIQHYADMGYLADADISVASASSAVSALTDEEKERIREEAVAEYKAQLAAEEKARQAAEAEKTAAIKEVKAMKKDDLAIKAAAMGLDVSDSDTAEVLRNKILAALGE